MIENGNISTFVDVYVAEDRTIQRAVDNPRQPQPPEVKPSTISESRKRGATVRKINHLVMKTAMELADGDPSRLVINDDDSVTVLNNPRPSRYS